MNNWCLAALISLSIWGTASRTIQDASNATPGSSDGISVLADAPSSDGTSDRHWEAVRPAAFPAGSSWTSQAHHAVLAGALCYSMAGARRTDDVAATPTPRARSPQFRTPLLI
jgi:hypothetical protein